jgi:iron(III) transport system ATP-binding protein
VTIAASYLQVAGLRKSFGHDVVVDGIGFSVEKGQILTLLGPSGCGKTTTLRCLAGLEQPDAGTIVVDGERMTSVADGISVPPERRDVGMVFQSYAVWPHMTVAENVGYPLEVRKWPRREIAARIDAVLDSVGLRPLRDRPATRLSGGQQQRVALARALVFNPRLLLFDEPLSNLDAKLREQLRLEIVRLQRQAGITSVYVTHDQAEAMVISDQIIVMRNGRIEQQGDAQAIYTAPASRFVAEFIGVANLLEGSVTGEAGGLLTVSVRLGGGFARLEARPSVREAKLAGEVLVCIRPEDIELADGGTEGVNRLHGRVASAVYMGSALDIVVDLGDATSVRVQAPAGTRVHPGDRVSLRTSPEACVCLPKEDRA